MKNEHLGLTEQEVRESYEKYGDNSLKREKKKGFLRRFFENLGDPIIKILIIALTLEVIFTLGKCNYFEIFGIIAAILISATVSTVSEYRSEEAFEKLNNTSDSLVTVLRSGKKIQIPASSIVKGDVVFLSGGEKVPADGPVISGRVSCDQSALNGESVECPKTPGSDKSFNLSNKSMLFRGALVTEGSAVMRAERIGNETFFGMVASDVQSETRASPLKIRLNKLAGQISKLGYLIAAIVGLTYLFNSAVVDNHFNPTLIKEYFLDFNRVFPTLISTLTLMITVVVVSAPEGLPMMITVVLSANMKRMLKDNVLVKKLVGIETAGSMNILFTDKTGTITEGAPTVEEIITASGVYKTKRGLYENDKCADLIYTNAVYNSEAQNTDDGVLGGNATDRALFSFFSGERVGEIRVKSKTPFKSEIKYSEVTFSDGRVFYKGAWEVLVKNTTLAIDKDGKCVPFNESLIYRKYKDAASRGERVIALCYKERRTSDMIFLALVVMKDKIRRGVKEAVASVKGAGIQTVMITGDSKDTATAIARECGISDSDDDIILDRSELADMSDDEIKAILPRLRVLSRALPQDKTRLVRLSQEMGLVAGMTGDGINDAPSLRLADVGFSMGSGSDIAKTASDIVILDNSFSAIEKTVLYGRTIFKSIRKFITFQLTMNLSACGISLIGQFIGIDTPITIIQMLWVNIIMDTLGGLAYAGEAPLLYYMKEKPKRREEPILTMGMLRSIFFLGAVSLIISIVFLTSPRVRLIFGSYDLSRELYTGFYCLFIFLGISNSFLARCERLWIFSDIGKNRPFVLIMLLISVIQIFMIYFGGELFRCTPLPVRELVFCISLALSVIPIEFIRRLLARLG